MFKSILVVALVVLFFPGCAIRKLQPPQYGTQIVQQAKILGIKTSVPTGTGGSILQFYLGYVSETTLIIPVVSNVNTNGEVSTNKPIVAAAPLSTTFGVSDTQSSIKLNDSVVSGYEDQGNSGANLMSVRRSLTLRPDTATNSFK